MQLPVRPRSLRNDPEVRIPQRRARLTELRSIEQIEPFRTEFQPGALVDRKTEIPLNTQVRRDRARPDKDVSACIALNVLRWENKRRLVEPSVYGWVTQFTSGDAIRPVQIPGVGIIEIQVQRDRQTSGQRSDTAQCPSAEYVGCRSAV